VLIFKGKQASLCDRIDAVCVRGIEKVCEGACQAPIVTVRAGGCQRPETFLISLVGLPGQNCHEYGNREGKSSMNRRHGEIAEICKALVSHSCMCMEFRSSYPTDTSFATIPR